MRITLPSLLSPFVNDNGTIQAPWNFFLQGLTAKPAKIASVVPTGSPFTYTAPNDGQLAIVGGTVSNVTLTRSGTAVSVGTPTIVGISQDDQVTITFSSVPTISYIPN